MSNLLPIADGLWTDEAEPRLIGGRAPDGRIRFPLDLGSGSEGWEPIAIGRTGTLWSWTRQSFEPKRPPYTGPVPFEPFLLGYIEIENEVIVEARLIDIVEPEIGMRLSLKIVPFDNSRCTYAFGPAA